MTQKLSSHNREVQRAPPNTTETLYSDITKATRLGSTSMAEQHDDWAQSYYQQWAQAQAMNPEQLGSHQANADAQPNAQQTPCPFRYGGCTLLHHHYHPPYTHPALPPAFHTPSTGFSAQTAAFYAQPGATYAEDSEMLKTTEQAWESAQTTSHAQLNADHAGSQQVENPMEGTAQAGLGADRDAQLGADLTYAQRLDADLAYAQQLAAELNGDLDYAEDSSPQSEEDAHFEGSPEMFYGGTFKAVEDYTAQYEQQMKKYDDLLKAQADAEKQLDDKLLKADNKLLKAQADTKKKFAALSDILKESQYAISAGSSKRQRVSPPRSTKEYRPDSSDYRIASNSSQSMTNFDTLTNVAAFLKSRKCGACRHPILPSAESVSRIFEKWQKGSTALSSHLKCPKCSAISTCIACRGKQSDEQSFIEVQERKVSWCCSGGRVIVLWLLLCGFDERYSGPKSDSRSTSTSGRGQSRGRIQWKKPRDNGVGFGSAYSEAYDDLDLWDFAPAPPSIPAPAVPGYENANASHPLYHWSAAFKGTADYHLLYKAGAKQRGDRRAKTETRQAQRKREIQEQEERLNANVLKLVAGLLPSVARGWDFDMDPPGAVANMLLESKILGYCAELLRSDSLEDASKRPVLYHSLCDFLGALGLHITTASVLFNERPVRPVKDTILALSFREGFEFATETTASLFDGLSGLITQSKLVENNARSHAHEYDTAEGRALLSLCLKITTLSEVLVPPHTEKSKKKIEPTVQKSLEAIAEVPLFNFTLTYAFRTFAQTTPVSARGRMKRLFTDITTLMTGLPSGIYVRYAADRPDIMKAIIFGPAGTPYENGIFEFDIACDGNFPHTPPQVQFKTTGGGRVHFNPNLYADGKVCLSLLGTWTGPGWKPGQSTLLQVLVSIQAMILCEEPYYNEPGHEQSRGTAFGNQQSRAYNLRVRELTMRHAILGWTKSPPLLWSDLVTEHFRRTGNKILETANKWVQEKETAAAPPARPSNASWDVLFGPDPHRRPRAEDSTLLELQMALRKYGATYEAPK
jgi:ubiquitin-protein ligase